MSATISGLGSGFDISSWVSQLVAAKKTTLVTPLQSKLSGLQSQSSAVSALESKYSTLQSALQSFTKVIYDSQNDMWTNTEVTSSNDAYATATTLGGVPASNVKLEIQQIATATKAVSNNCLGRITNENADKIQFTNLVNGQAKTGDFSMFLDGKEYKVTIENNDSLKDVMDKINSVSDGKIQASIDSQGNFSIKAYKNAGDEQNPNFVVDENAKLSLGSGGDTSNIFSALKMYTKEGEYSYTSSHGISSVNTSKAMASSESGLEEIKFFDGSEPADSGKITINGIDFKVDKNTTLDGLISKINSNSDVNVKASYDSLNNKLVLTSTQTGESNISLSEEGTNLLNVLGFTEYSGPDEIIATGSQILGQNAIVKINDNTVISTSNTITGESSGISNLSITIKKQTSDASGNPNDEKEILLGIEPDYTAVKDALKKFVNAYNDAFETTRKYTSTDGAIGHDASLNSILSSLRSITSKVSQNDGEFTMLAEIGISTSKSNLTALTIDETKLDKALKENFESVKLLLSDGYVSKKDNGIFDGLLSNIDGILDKEKGYFTNKDNSIQSLIKSTNTRIERANKQLNSYETRITNQFNAMDSTISKLTAQLSQVQGYLR